LPVLGFLTVNAVPVAIGYLFKGQGARAKVQGLRVKGRGSRAKCQGARAKGQGSRAKG